MNQKRFNDTKKIYDAELLRLYESTERTEKYIVFLDYSMKLYKMPFISAFSLYAQNAPEVCATLDGWNKLGRKVKRAEIGITALVSKSGYTTYYNAEQTIGKPMKKQWALSATSAEETVDYYKSSRDIDTDLSFEKLIYSLAYTNVYFDDGDIIENLSDYSEEQQENYIDMLVEAVRYTALKRCELNNGGYSFNNPVFSIDFNFLNIDDFEQFCTYVQKYAAETIKDVCGLYYKSDIRNREIITKEEVIASKISSGEDISLTEIEPVVTEDNTIIIGNDDVTVEEEKQPLSEEIISVVIDDIMEDTYTLYHRNDRYSEVLSFKSQYEALETYDEKISLLKTFLLEHGSRNAGSIVNDKEYIYDLNENGVTVRQYEDSSVSETTNITFATINSLASKKIDTDAYVPSSLKKENEELIFVEKKTKKNPRIKTVDDSQLSFFNFTEAPEITDPITIELDPAVLDHVLRCGSVKDKSIIRIVSQFRLYDDTAINAEFLKNEFSEYGMGYVLPDSDKKYAVVFNESGITIAEGENFKNCILKTTYSWEQAAQRINELLQEGAYADQLILDLAEKYEINELSKTLRFLETDLIADYNSFLPDEIKNKHDEEIIADYISDKERLRKFVDNEFAAFLKDYDFYKKNEQSILRFNNYKPHDIADRLSRLADGSRDFKADKEFALDEKYFVTEEQKELVIKNKTGLYNKIELSDYHKEERDEQEGISKLKGLFGTGGSSDLNGSFSYDSKGIAYSYGSYQQRKVSCPMKWNEVNKIVKRLIKEDSFISQDEIDTELKRIARLRSINIELSIYQQNFLDRFGKKELTVLEAFRSKTDEHFVKIKWYGAADIEDHVKYFVDNVLSDNYLNGEIGEVVLTGSRCRGLETADSDVDVVVEIKGADISENALFNYIHENKINVGGVLIDINPIRPEETGDIETYLLSVEEYLNRKREDKEQLEKAKENIRSYLESEFLSENISFDDLEHISAGYTELGENNEHGFQMEIDLVNLKIRYELDNEIVKTESYNSLEEMNELALSELNFDDFYAVGDDVLDTEAKDSKAIDLLADRLTENHDGKFSVEEYYKKASPSVKDLADYIKSLVINDRRGFGLGGYAASPNGITLPDLSEYSWEQVAQAVIKAIENDRYISADERAEKSYAPTAEDIKIGDKYILKNFFGEKEVTVTSLNGVYPDDVGITETNRGESGQEYTVTTNINRKELHNNGIYLGNEADIEEHKTINPRPKIPNTLAHRNFVNLKKQFPNIMSRTHTYEKYESDIYMPLSLEWISEDELSIAHTYVQNGDLMYDPMIDVKVDFEKQTVNAIRYEMSAMGIYHEYAENTPGQKDCNNFLVILLKNLKLQNRYLSTAVFVNEKGEDERVTFDKSRNKETDTAAAEVIEEVTEITEGAIGIYNGENAVVIDIDESENRAEIELVGHDNEVTQEISIDELKTGFEEYVEPLPDIIVENKPVVPAQDYRYNEQDKVTAGPKQKYKANVDAIRLLKALEAENRNAAPEEQSILAKYSGWGGVPQAFDRTNILWRNEYDELKELLDEEEYEAARASTLTAYYTPPEIIDAVYTALENFGFEGGNVLEPSMAVGNFFAKMPENLKNSSKLYGVELDSISGRIAKKLYPSANIQIKGFEKTSFRDNSFDVVIGNIPFGDFKVVDKKYDKYNFSIHDYFIAKALDQVKPGGVVAFVTSKFTMDKQSSSVRRYISERAVLLGAVRLPADTFKNSGTETTTDILFFKKRKEREIVHEPEWLEVREDADGVAYNSYFHRRPDMMLGKMAFDERMRGKYGEDAKVTACYTDKEDPRSFTEKLSEAINKIDGKMSVSKAANEAFEQQENVITADPNVRNFTYTLVDGNLYYRENEIMRRSDATGVTLDRIVGIHNIRQAAMTLITEESQNCSDERMTELQRRLNDIYDKFVKKYGYLNDSANVRAFADDDDSNTILALENKTDEKKYQKAAIFFKRTIMPDYVANKVETADEALQVSIDRLGRVDLTFMAQLSDISEDKLIEELGTRIFRNPLNADNEKEYSGYEEASEYLSGNVRKKLAAAKAYAETDSSYERNVTALEKVMPPKIPAQEISVRIGSAWIEDKTYNEFFEHYAHETTSRSYSNKITRTALGEYKFTNGTKSYSTSATEIFGTDRFNSFQIFEALLNQKQINVYDVIYEDGKDRRVVNASETRLAREKARQMEEAFKTWIWSDIDRREYYETKYNETFNCLIGREYNGDFQRFDGMSTEITLKKHQKDAVLRAKLGGNTLFAHVVGAGKSFEMITSVQEKKRLGLISKACVTVPKALTEQMGAEWMRLYPNAKILVATTADFSKDKRQQFIARCATGDYDAIIMSHEQFGKIGMSSEYQNQFIRNQISQLDIMISDMGYSNEARVSVKSLEKQRKRLEAKLDKALNVSRDNSLSFEKLGFDFLVVDEAHMFKNCFINTKMGNIAGVQTTASNKATDMLMKCDYLNERYGCNNILFATGTPNASPYQH